MLQRPVKDLQRDLPAWELAEFGGDVSRADLAGLVRAWREVGEAYLLEASLGVPFFDLYASARDGGFEAAVLDFLNPDLGGPLERLQAKYVDRLVALAAAVCEETPVETLIRGTADDVRREVGEILDAFEGTPRVIVGTGDQVGRETPVDNLHAMIDEAKRLGARS